MGDLGDSLRGIRFTKFEFELQAREPLHLPTYKGSTLRGAFGHAFRSVTCALKRAECDGCPLRHKCAYSYVFFTPPPPSAAMMRKYPHAPHPFVLEPPDESKQFYAAGESFRFGLVLIGKGADYLPYFVFAFKELGSRGIGRGNGRFTLEAVRHITPGDSRQIFSARDNLLEEPHECLTLSELAPVEVKDGALHIQFLTPARLKDEGHLSPDVDFPLLIRSLLRRLSTLAYFHCGVELDLDYRGLIARAGKVAVSASTLRWYDWERYSSRQDVRMKMGGVLGAVTYRGDLSEFLPLILLGEHLHVGKGTSMGLGRYKISRA